MPEIELPDDLILPIPLNKKEEEFYKTLQDHAKSINRTFATLQDPVDELVKASSGDPTAGYLDSKVDGTTIEVSGNQLRVVAGSGVSGAGGDGLTEAAGVLSVNVDNSTLEINADSLRVKDDGVTDAKIRLTNDGWLTGRNQANNGDINIVKVGTDNYLYAGAAFSLLTGGAVDEFSTDGTLAGNSDSAVPTEKAVKTYVDALIVPPLSNEVFAWSSIADDESCATTSATYVTKLNFRFKKLAGVNNISLQARGHTADTGGGPETCWIKVDIGGANNEVSTVSTTPVWITAVNIDISGLSTGTVYDGTVQLKMADGAENVFLDAITLIAS